MPRQVSERVWDGLHAQETSQAYLVLVRLSHPGLDQPLRVTSDGARTTSRGQEYVPYPMRINLPPDRERENTRMQIQIDNVDRLIVETLRSVSEPATVEVELVEADTPDLVEAGPFEFSLITASYDALWVTGTLAYEPKMRATWPAVSYDPATAPGVF